MPKASSRRQARFFGAIRGGARKHRSLTAAKAGEMLRGVRLKGLPERARRGKTRGRKRR